MSRCGLQNRSLIREAAAAKVCMGTDKPFTRSNPRWASPRHALSADVGHRTRCAMLLLCLFSSHALCLMPSVPISCRTMCYRTKQFYALDYTKMDMGPEFS